MHAHSISRCLFVASLSLSAVLFSCAGSDPEKPPSGDVCQSSSRAASERVAKVAAENLACASDADCVVVGVGATCFDACTRDVNQTGKGAVDRASTLVEASECKKFNEAGCRLDHPPCAPPREARCENGQCQ